MSDSQGDGAKVRPLRATMRQAEALLPTSLHKYHAYIARSLYCVLLLLGLCLCLNDKTLLYQKSRNDTVI